MTRIELGLFNFCIDIDLPPKYEHSHEFPPDPQAFWDAMIPIMRKLVESHPRTYNYQRGDRWKKRGVPPMAQAVVADFGHSIYARGGGRGCLWLSSAGTAPR